MLVQPGWRLQGYASRLEPHMNILIWKNYTYRLGELLRADLADVMAPAAQQQLRQQKCHEPFMTTDTDHATLNHDQNASTTQPFHGSALTRTPDQSSFARGCRTVVAVCICLVLCRSVPYQAAASGLHVQCTALQVPDERDYATSQGSSHCLL